MRTRRMRALAVLVVAAAIALAVGSVVLQDRSDAARTGPSIRPGTYETEWVIPKARRNSYDNPTAGRVEFRMPEAGGKTPLPRIHGTLTLWNGRDKFLFALDASGANYDVLRLDVNRNGDISDDKMIKGVPRREHPEDPSVRYVFAPAAAVPVKELIAGATSENTMMLDFYVSQSNSEVYQIEVRSRGCLAGNADSDKGPIPFRILDYNMNGSYSDPWAMLSKEAVDGDMVIFDWSGKGDFGGVFGEYPRCRAASSPANIFGELLTLNPSESGDRLIVSRYDGPSGHIEVKGGKIGKTEVKVHCLRFVEVTGHTQTYSLPDAGTPLEVPAGEYYLSRIEAVPVGDEEFPNWSLQLTPYDPVCVEKGKTATVLVAGDLRMKLRPEEETITIGKGERVGIQVGLLLSDRGIVTINEMSGSGKRGTSYMLPTMQMKDSGGKVVHKGRVDWAGSHRALTDKTALPQTLKPGKYTYEVDFDTGPFGGVLKARKTVIIK
jgi:hypothetical protein